MVWCDGSGDGGDGVVIWWYGGGGSGDGCHGVVIWWYGGDGSGNGCHRVVVWRSIKTTGRQGVIMETCLLSDVGKTAICRLQCYRSLSGNGQVLSLTQHLMACHLKFSLSLCSNGRCQLDTQTDGRTDE